MRKGKGLRLGFFGFSDIQYYDTWGFPKLRVPCWGAPITRIIEFFGVYIVVPLFWETTTLRSHVPRQPPAMLKGLHLGLIPGLGVEGFGFRVPWIDLTSG